MGRHALPVLLLPVLTACSQEAPRHGEPDAQSAQSSQSRPGSSTQPTPPSDPPYTGPECKAELADEGKGKVVKVSVHVPTLGYALVLDSVVDAGKNRDGDKALRVLLTLTSPAADEAVGQAFETLVARASVPPGHGEVLVLISRERRREM